MAFIDTVKQIATVGGVKNIDDLITQRTPQALRLLKQGSASQLGFQRQGLLEATQPLEALLDDRAFNEQQALLGLSGEEAQQEAIGGIPLSDFDIEMQKRQRQQLMRGAAARGEAGGGATLQAGAQLAGAQQAGVITNRLAQLEPSVALQRGLRGALSQIGETGLESQANTQFGLGSQMANIRLGSAAPQIQSIQDQAELSGLRKISSANQKNQQVSQVAGLAGMFFGGR